MNSIQDTFGAAADAWDEDGHEELAKTFQDGAGATNDFFDLGNNDLGKKLTLKLCRKLSNNDLGKDSIVDKTVLCSKII